MIYILVLHFFVMGAWETKQVKKYPYDGWFQCWVESRSWAVTHKRLAKVYLIRYDNLWYHSCEKRIEI